MSTERKISTPEQMITPFITELWNSDEYSPKTDRCMPKIKLMLDLVGKAMRQQINEIQISSPSGDDSSMVWATVNGSTTEPDTALAYTKVKRAFRDHQTRPDNHSKLLFKAYEANRIGDIDFDLILRRQNVDGVDVVLDIRKIFDYLNEKISKLETDNKEGIYISYQLLPTDTEIGSETLNLSHTGGVPKLTLSLIEDDVQVFHIDITSPILGAPEFNKKYNRRKHLGGWQEATESRVLFEDDGAMRIEKNLRELPAKLSDPIVIETTKSREASMEIAARELRKMLVRIISKDSTRNWLYHASTLQLWKGMRKGNKFLDKAVQVKIRGTDAASDIYDRLPDIRKQILLQEILIIATIHPWLAVTFLNESGLMPVLYKEYGIENAIDHPSMQRSIKSFMRNKSLKRRFFDSNELKGWKLITELLLLR